jgi:hypothetical protein
MRVLKSRRPACEGFLLLAEIVIALVLQLFLTEKFWQRPLPGLQQ